MSGSASCIQLYAEGMRTGYGQDAERLPTALGELWYRAGAWRWIAWPVSVRSRMCVSSDTAYKYLGSDLVAMACQSTTRRWGCCSVMRMYIPFPAARPVCQSQHCGENTQHRHFTGPMICSARDRKYPLPELEICKYKSFLCMSFQWDGMCQAIMALLGSSITRRRLVAAYINGRVHLR